MRITIIFILTWLGNVFGPAIERNPAIRTMKVYRKVLVCKVSESYNRFSTLGHSERGTGRYPIISHKLSWLQPRINLLLEWFDVNFVEVNFISGGRILVCA
jgi:hypothetical protein